MWDWPIIEKNAGYVKAWSLSNIGKWTEFSPADINIFCGKINRPNPKYTTPIESKTPWLTSLSIKKGMCKINKIWINSDNYLFRLVLYTRPSTLQRNTKFITNWNE